MEERLDDWTDVGLIVSRLMDADEDFTVSWCDDVVRVEVSVRELYVVTLLFDKDGRLKGVEAEEEK